MTAPFAGWEARLGCEHAAVTYLGWLLHGVGACVIAPDGHPLTAAELALSTACEQLPRAPWSLQLCSPTGARYTARFRALPRPCPATGSDAAAWAWGGLASMSGEPDGPPLSPGAPLASICAALHAFLAFAAARVGGYATVSVEIALGDVVASLLEIAGLKYAAEGTIRSRGGDWWGLAGWGVYPCSDGKIAIALRDPDQLGRLGDVLTLPELRSERYGGFMWGVSEHVDELNGLLVGGLLDHSMHEIANALRRQRIAVAPLLDFDALLRSPHLLERNALILEDGMVLPRFLIRGLGGEPADDRASRGRASAASRPLRGVRVLDLSSVWAGPMAARLLADLGASVTSIERPNRRVGLFATGAAWDRDFYSILNNRNKRTLACDLQSSPDREALVALVREADVLVENFIPGSLDRLGLGHDALHALNPRLIVVAMPAAGLAGPDASAAGYGSTIEHAAGLGWLYADSSGEPHRSGINFSDPIAGVYAAIGAILGLLGDRHKRTIEISQQEAALSLMLPAFARCQRTAERPRAIVAERQGDRWMVPVRPGNRRHVPVRDVAEVMGRRHSPGSRANRWLEHPDGRFYPLPVLPWRGAFSTAVYPQPARMPEPIAAAGSVATRR